MPPRCRTCSDSIQHCYESEDESWEMPLVSEHSASGPQRPFLWRGFFVGRRSPTLPPASHSGGRSRCGTSVLIFASTVKVPNVCRTILTQKYCSVPNASSAVSDAAREANLTNFRIFNG